MRILGYLDHPVFKITVFKTDTRLSLKFENGDFEQTYKFRPTEHSNGLQEIGRLLDDDFLRQVDQRFDHMKADFSGTFSRNIQPEEEDEFPDII
ncbi:MAG: hypothetical protein AAFP77_17240 [Bacteroidota bacterium]